MVFVHESSEGTFTVVSLILLENVVSCSQREGCSQYEIPGIGNPDAAGLYSAPCPGQSWPLLRGCKAATSRLQAAQH